MEEEGTHITWESINREGACLISRKGKEVMELRVSGSSEDDLASARRGRRRRGDGLAMKADLAARVHCHPS